jgi:hypothetical protein
VKPPVRRQRVQSIAQIRVQTGPQPWPVGQEHTEPSPDGAHTAPDAHGGGVQAWLQHDRWSLDVSWQQDCEPPTQAPHTGGCG